MTVPAVVPQPGDPHARLADARRLKLIHVRWAIPQRLRARRKPKPCACPGPYPHAFCYVVTCRCPNHGIGAR
ncbi:hypothetical protein [Micromonospora chalcea]|uniref:hypothetical protein n=1 Tax=Micromonospora chalcea TaxID=1874 RepID=UPI003D7170DB